MSNTEETQSKRKRTIDNITEWVKTVDEDFQKEADAILAELESRLAARKQELAKRRAEDQLKAVRDALTNSRAIVVADPRDLLDDPHVLTAISSDNTTATLLRPGQKSETHATLDGYWAWVRKNWVSVAPHVYGASSGNSIESLLQRAGGTVMLYKDEKFFYAEKGKDNEYQCVELVPTLVPITDLDRFRLRVTAKPASA